MPLRREPPGRQICLPIVPLYTLKATFVDEIGLICGPGCFGGRQSAAGSRRSRFPLTRSFGFKVETRIVRLLETSDGRAVPFGQKTPVQLFKSLL